MEAAMATRDKLPDTAVVVELCTPGTKRWPLWMRRWLLLEAGTILVPVSTDDGGEGLRALREAARYVIFDGRLYVDAEWLLAVRKGAARSALSRAITKIRRAAGCG